MSAQPNRLAVSIIVPAYNISQHIQETLDSILAQTFTDYEIIIINDGSPDTAELERVLEPYKGRFVYLKQPNRGVSAARNHGIRHARADYIAFLDGDDLWKPEFLKKQVEAMQRDPSLDLIYTDSIIFGPTPSAGRRYMELNPSERPVTLESLLARRANVITSCVLARRSAILDAGLFDEDYRYSEDFDLWCRMASLGKRIDFQAEALGARRAGGVTSNTAAYMKGIARAYEKQKTLRGLSEEGLQLIDANVRYCLAEADLEQGKLHLAAKRYSDAYKSFRKANNYYNRPKLRALLFALRFMPWAVNAITACWNYMLGRKARLAQRTYAGFSR